MLIQYDPDLGHRFVHNQVARLNNECGGYLVRTNSDGFRSNHDFSAEKSEKPRLLMFGDSYTAGDNVSNEDRFSDIIARQNNCEVYNYGIPGSGTDQHLLAYRKFGKNIQADGIIICVQIDSFLRIQSSSRISIDRTTGDKVNVPKPYFELENGRLSLEQVPVPLQRSAYQPDKTAPQRRTDNLLDVAHRLYSTVPGLKTIRESPLVKNTTSRLITEFRRYRGKHSYPDIDSADSNGWKLMHALLKAFISEAAPLPVFIFPIPTRDFYLVGMAPTYQKLFQQLNSPQTGVHVGDVSTPLVNLPYKERLKLSFEIGGHFTPYANRLVAEEMSKCLKKHGALSDQSETQNTSPTIKSIIPPRPTYVLGISCFYHNSAAALLRDGEIVAAAEEERFSRIKNDRGFPKHAINYCLEQAGINETELSAVVSYDDAALTFERIIQTLAFVDNESARRMWSTIIPSWARTKLHFAQLVHEQLRFDGKVLQGNHHRSHAASCFFPSPYENAAILTVDGVGEWATASIGYGSGQSLKLLKEMSFPNSLGLLYSAFTHFTGFKVNSGEYKMMGLAPYGSPIYTDLILEHIVSLKDDGSLSLNMEYFTFLHDTNSTSSKFDELFDGPRRDPESRITQREMDIARSIQEVTEMAIIRMAKYAKELTGAKNLCLAGGVALNCVANGKLLRENIFENIWIQPAAGDSGCALGAALDAWHTYFGNTRSAQKDLSDQGGSYLGPDFSPEECKAFLNTHGYPYQEYSDESRADNLAQYLEEGKVVGHFSGRLEYGPRSLGARSILGDARNTEMQTKLNLQIKYRESFRPFAPAVLAEDAEKFFNIHAESPYMLLVAPVKEERRLQPERLDTPKEDLLPIVRQARSDIPAVTHVDFSARIQTVRKDHHPVFYKLIEAFKRRTGYGIIVNTSFNVRGEPIVCTPYDAYRCFMRTEMDILALGNLILIKDEQPVWPEGTAEGLENEDLPRKIAPRNSDKFLKSIENVFESEFSTARQAISGLPSQMSRHQTGQASKTTWEDAVEEPYTKEDFEFAFDWRHPTDDVQLSAAILRRWRNQNLAQQFSHTLISLLRARTIPSLDSAIDGEICDSVYVMF